MPYLDHAKVCAHCGKDIDTRPYHRDMEAPGAGLAPDHSREFADNYLAAPAAVRVERWALPERPEHGRDNYICADCDALLTAWLQDGYTLWRQRQGER